MVSTERILLVLLIVGSCAAPETSILPPFCCTGIESPAIIGEWQDTGLPIGISTICLGCSCLLAAHSIAQTSAEHLIISLCLQPLHPHRVNHTTVCDTVAMWNWLRLRLGLVNSCPDICDGTSSGRGGLQRRMPFTLPLPSAIACADALEQVSPVILLAPGISNSI